MSTTHKAWQYHPTATTHDEFEPQVLQNLVLKDVPKPSPGPGQALVRIKAAGLNFRDLLLAAGSPKYPNALVPGTTPLCDGAGLVEAAGPGSEWTAGDAVMIRALGSWDRGDVSNFDGTDLGSGSLSGTLQEYRLLEDHWLVRKPAYLSWEQAAVVLGVGGTAVNALFHTGVSIHDEGREPLGLRGKTVVTQGTGGTSLMTLQVAAAAGARVIATSSSDAKGAFLRRLGAAEFVNYRAHADWAAEVLKLTEDSGVDLVVDVAGAGSLAQSIRAARFGGAVAMVGFLTEDAPVDVVRPVIFGAKRLVGLVDSSREMSLQLVELLERHRIEPVIAKVFGFEEAREAYGALMGQSEMGKFVVRVS